MLRTILSNQGMPPMVPKTSKEDSKNFEPCFEVMGMGADGWNDQGWNAAAYGCAERGSDDGLRNLLELSDGLLGGSAAGATW